MLVGLPWNLWVLGVILYKSLYCQPIVMLMLNLTITNILLILMVMPRLRLCELIHIWIYQLSQM